MMSMVATSIQSSETIQHLTGSGLFGIFCLLLIVIGLEKWVSYQSQRDRMKMEEARIDRNEKGLMESRRIESESRDKLSEALNNVSRMVEGNGIKIDEMRDDLETIGDKVGEHEIKIAALEGKEKEVVK